MFKIKDPFSGFSHLVGAILIIIGTFFLLVNAKALKEIICFLCFGITALILYGASTLYHLFGKPASEISSLRKVDHASIYLLIAGTFTPFCILLVDNIFGLIILIIVWLLAISGITATFFDSFWKHLPRWASTGLYILMGWIGALIIYPLRHYPFILLWIFIGGAFYTIGAVIYIIKKPNPFKGFGFHELFHILVLLGTASHFIAIYYLAVQPPST